MEKRMITFLMEQINLDNDFFYFDNQYANWIETKETSQNYYNLLVFKQKLPKFPQEMQKPTTKDMFQNKVTLQ